MREPERSDELVVVALGGNALLQRGERLDATVQQANVARAATTLAAVAHDHRLVVTHGNGPQVGLLALQNDAYDGVSPYPLDVLDAESEGMIGYVLDQYLANALPDTHVATLLTQVVVDSADPAFGAPSKPIGPVYDEATARRLADERGWTVMRDGPAWRRAVASPAPREIVEVATIRLLVLYGVLVVCAGGGGIPVVRTAAGALRGVEAVIDKDATSSLLARDLGADRLVMLTDVTGVATGWGSDEVRWLRTVAPDRLRALSFARGSMQPKIDAACDFVEATGGVASVGSLSDLPAILDGDAGTTIARDVHTTWHRQPWRAAS